MCVCVCVCVRAGACVRACARVQAGEENLMVVPRSWWRRRWRHGNCGGGSGDGVDGEGLRCRLCNEVRQMLAIKCVSHLGPAYQLGRCTQLTSNCWHCAHLLPARLLHVHVLHRMGFHRSPSCLWPRHLWPRQLRIWL